MSTIWRCCALRKEGNRGIVVLKDLGLWWLSCVYSKATLFKRLCSGIIPGQATRLRFGCATAMPWGCFMVLKFRGRWVLGVYRGLRSGLRSEFGR